MSIVLFFLLVCVAAPLVLQAWQTRPTRSGFPEQALLGGPNAPPVVYKGDKLSRDANNQLELRLDVQRLYALASELKEEVDRSNTDATLSATVLKRTQDIEKLAKQIRDRAKR